MSTIVSCSVRTCTTALRTPWRRQQLAGEARTWVMSSGVSFRCKICERARAGFCRFAWKASVSSSQTARYDSHSRESHIFLCYYREESRARLSFSLSLPFSLSLSLSLSRIAHISISIYPSYSTFNCCVMLDRIYLLVTLIWGLLSSFVIPSTILRLDYMILRPLWLSMLYRLFFTDISMRIITFQCLYFSEIEIH